MANYNIVMKQLNAAGTYDELYPKTVGTQVDGIFTSEQTLSNNTKSLYGFGTSAVPDEVFSKLSHYMNDRLVVEKIMSSQMWTAPKARDQEFLVLAAGGGGGGGRDASNAEAGAGGGGGYVAVKTVNIKENEVVNIVCGAAGVPFIPFVVPAPPLPP